MVFYVKGKKNEQNKRNEETLTGSLFTSSRRRCSSLSCCFALARVVWLTNEVILSSHTNMNLSSVRLDSKPISSPQQTFNGRCCRIDRFPIHPSVFGPSKTQRRPAIVCSVKAVTSSLGVNELKGEDLDRIRSLSQVSGVLGCQWGDEGKGKLVDILAKHFDIVARCQVTFFS